jgi:ABC-type polysaccharide/polyol phosphate transport system ATPase subunit
LKHYSSGMHARLSFSIAVHLKGDVLIIDEALSAGDLAFHEKSTRKIRELLDSGMTCIAASHNLEDIQENFDRACILAHGKIVAEGAADSIVQEYRLLMTGSGP